MRFVDDDGVVGGEIAVGLRFGQQNAIGHQLHISIARGVVVETHFIADSVADVAAQFFGNPLRHRTRRQTPRLGMPDQARTAAPEFQTDFRQLGGFARPRFAANNGDLMVGDGVFNVVQTLVHRQSAVIPRPRQLGLPFQIGIVRFLVFFLHRVQAAEALRMFKGLGEKMAVAGEGLAKIGLLHDGLENSDKTKAVIIAEGLCFILYSSVSLSAFCFSNNNSECRL